MGNPESFKRNESASAPPSTPRATLSKKPGLKMLALNRRLWTESGGFSPGGIKDKDYNTPYPDPLPGHKPEEMRVSYKGTENNARRSETSQRNLTRSKTILRRLSSNFFVRSRTTGPNLSQPLFRSPTQIASAFGSKETREAALRERGLLPPSKPNVDLSSVERERDRHLPVLMPPHDEEVSVVDGQGSRISAAAKVKEEWETKYREYRGLERMKGSSIGDSMSSPVKDISPPAIARPSDFVEQPYETPNLLPIAITSASPTKSTSTALNSLSNNLNHCDFQTESQPLSSFSEPYLTPLPPSPSPSTTSLNRHEEISIVSLSQSPSSGFDTSSASPTIPVTPPVIPLLHSSTGLESLHSTPVFHAASPEMTAPHVTSITTSSELFANDDAVMMESPVETPLSGSNSISGGPRDSSHFEVTIARDVSAAESADLPKARPRNLTDPTYLRIHQIEPRKSSFYPFRRFTDPPPNTNSPRRLSVRASLNNLRRSLVGTLSHAKSAGLGVRTDEGFIPPHLPPSPTFPAVDINQAGVSPATGLRLSPTQYQESPELKRRVSVSPILYSRGTIVEETNNIEDEESRRMTELAFLA